MNGQAKKSTTTKYGIKSLCTLVSRIWDNLPDNTKKKPHYLKVKEFINQWFCPNCKSSLCSNLNHNHGHGHNILSLSDALPNFPFTTSKSKRDY